ncbi:MAG TPA: hypothetical protein V6C76_04760 [Drouetiella sp.]
MILKIAKTKVALPIVALLLGLGAIEPSYAAGNTQSEQLRAYKAQMIECFNTGKFAWCSDYAQRIAAGTQDPAEKGFAEYYNANSLLKLGKSQDARAAYLRAKSYSTDPTIVRNCDQGIQSIRVTGTAPDNRTILFDVPGSHKNDNSVDAMIARERDQLAAAGGANGMDYKSWKDVESFLPRYQEYMNRIETMEAKLRELNAQQQTPEIVAQEAVLTRSIDYWKKQIEQSSQYNAAFKALLLKLDQFQSQEKQALTQRNSSTLNTEPKLQTVGSDLYTKNYTSGASQPTPKTGDPNELMATEERMVLDAHSVPGKTISRIVKVPAETKPTNADLKVNGKLVP